jgi:hypothetical protein
MISTYELELFAKQAATDYLKDGKSLNESITKIASDNGLNDQQINRVVEAANTETYLNLHNKSTDKYVSFPTADPAVIENNLSVAKVAEAVVVDDSDYIDAPAYEAPVYTAPLTKVAEEVISERSNDQEVRDYYRFKAAEAHLENLLVDSQLLFSSEAEKLGLMIKQAVLGGTNYSEIRTALNTNSDPVFIATLDAIENELTPVMPMNSLNKTASAIKGSVNANHPLLQQSVKLIKIAGEYKTLKDKLNELMSEWSLYKEGGTVSKTVEMIAAHPKSLGIGLALGAGGVGLAIPFVANQTAKTNHSVTKQIPEMYRS